MFSTIVTKHVYHAKGDQKSDGDIGGKGKAEQRAVPDLENMCEGAVNLCCFGKVDRLGKSAD